MSVDILKQVQDTIVGLEQLPPDQQLLVVKYYKNIKEGKAEVLTSMDEELFWELIDLINWESKDPFEATKPIEIELSQQSDQGIYLFQDILAHKLTLLDGPAYFEAAPGSSDSFLYARCCVVANGKAFYEKVLNDPKEFPNGLYFTLEAMLYVADNAYELKHDKELNRVPAYNYESFFNEEAWGEKAIKL